MKFSVVIAFLLSIVGTSAGILIAWAAYFPALPTLWSEVMAIGLGALLLMLSVGLSRTVVRGLISIHERSLIRRFPAANWLWRRDWSRRMSCAENTVCVSIIVWTLVCMVSVAIAMVARFAPDERAAWVGFIVLLGIVWLALLVDSGFRRARAPLHNILYFDDDPATSGGTASFYLTVSNRKNTARWESVLVCDHLIDDSTPRSQAAGKLERRVELWRSEVHSQSLLADARSEIKPRFDIPIGAIPTGPHRNGTIEWRVIVQGTSSLGDVTYDKSFVVPVAAASRGATDVRWVTQSNNTDTIDNDQILSEKNGLHDMSFAALKGPVWQGLKDGLAGAHIDLYHKGIQFGDKVWRTETTFVRAKYEGVIWTIALLLFFAAVGLNDVWSFSVVMSCTIAAGGVCLGLGQALFNIFHRFNLVFEPNYLISNHRWLGLTWDRRVSWAMFHTITWERVGFGFPERRRVVVNPDGGRLRRVVSPLITDGVVVDNIIDALELCRAVFRRHEVTPQNINPAPMEPRNNFIEVPGYNAPGVMRLQ